MSEKLLSDKPGHIRVQRYSGSARINHWIVATTFVCLAVSGLALFHPSLFSLTALFGGGQTARWLHPWLGVLLVAAYLGLFVRFWAQNLPERTDWIWLTRIRDVLAAREDYLPEVGKYNAGQKMVFWAQSVLITILLFTGIGLWPTALANIEALLGIQVSIDARRWAAVIHASAAVLAIVIWIVHVYAAIWVRGTFSSMTRGTVSGGWGWRHHRKWLRSKVEKGEVDRDTTPTAG